MSVNIDCVVDDYENDGSQDNDLKAPGTPEIVGTKGMRTYVPQSNSRVNAIADTKNDVITELITFN